jgi:hypothetical protein
MSPISNITGPERITQQPVALASTKAAANPVANFTPEAQSAARRMIKQGESATDGVDKPQTGNSEISFFDFLDIINPLQHIPLVSDIYREVTGDTIKPELKLAGGAVTGGIFGFLASLGDVIFEGETGNSVGGSMLASLGFGEDSDQSVADAQTKQTQKIANNAYSKADALI